LLQRIKQPRVREAFILRKRDELSNKEIAQTMGISEDTVKEYLARAAEQLPTLDGHHKGRHPTGSTQRKKEK
jgi:RNA polymerase sigma factor (sigma-70 family)